MAEVKSKRYITNEDIVIFSPLDRFKNKTGAVILVKILVVMVVFTHLSRRLPTDNTHYAR